MFSIAFCHCREALRSSLSHTVLFPIIDSQCCVLSARQHETGPPSAPGSHRRSSACLRCQCCSSATPRTLSNHPSASPRLFSRSATLSHVLPPCSSAGSSTPFSAERWSTTGFVETVYHLRQHRKQVRHVASSFSCTPGTDGSHISRGVVVPLVADLTGLSGNLASFVRTERRAG